VFGLLLALHPNLSWNLMLNMRSFAHPPAVSLYPVEGIAPMRVEEAGQAPRCKQKHAGRPLGSFHIPEAVSCWTGSCRMLRQQRILFNYSPGRS
jgi:hypothetical protein